MKPLTAIRLDALGPAVVGMPYSSCRHVGVIEVAQDAGAALAAKLLEVTAFLNVGTLELIIAKLKVKTIRVSEIGIARVLPYILDCRVHKLNMAGEIRRNRVRKGADHLLPGLLMGKGGEFGLQ